MSRSNDNHEGSPGSDGLPMISFTVPPQLHAYLKDIAATEDKSLEEFTFETLLNGLRRRFTTCYHKGEVVEEFLDHLTGRAPV